MKKFIFQKDIQTLSFYVPSNVTTDRYRQQESTEPEQTGRSQLY